MVSACEDCLRRPTGLEGHEHLSLAATRKVGPVFKCSRCALSWVRSYEGNGVFVWIEHGYVEGDGDIR